MPARGNAPAPIRLKRGSKNFTAASSFSPSEDGRPRKNISSKAATKTASSSSSRTQDQRLRMQRSTNSCTLRR